MQDLVGPIVFFAGSNLENMVKPRHLGFVYPAAAMESFAEFCGKEHFVPGVDGKEWFECSTRIGGLPDKLSDRHIFWPLASLSAVLPKLTPKGSEFFTQKSLEFGIYDPQLRVSFEKEQNSNKRVKLSIDGETVGTFLYQDLHPLLRQLLVGVNCRDLLTSRGQQRYCID